MDSYIDISFHVIVSSLLGYAVWRLFDSHDKKIFTISLFFTLLGGVLIDVDHFIDHFLSFGLNFNYDYFIKGEYFLRSSRAYIVFHGFEYVILFGVLALLVKARIRKVVFIAIALGMLSHLLIDAFLFPNSIMGYSIFYRLLNGFNTDILE